MEPGVAFHGRHIVQILASVKIDTCKILNGMTLESNEYTHKKETIACVQVFGVRPARLDYLGPNQ